jgi:hypothetical protein
MHPTWISIDTTRCGSSKTNVKDLTKEKKKKKKVSQPRKDSTNMSISFAFCTRDIENQAQRDDERYGRRAD